MEQQGIRKGDVLQKLAGISFIVGAVLLIVFNMLFPRVSDPTNMTQMVQSIASIRGGLWEVINLFMAAGIWAAMIGFAGVYRGISAGGAAAWARLGYYGVIVGTTVWTVLFAFQGFGLSLAVQQWQVASGAAKETLGAVAGSLTSIGFGLFSMSIIVFWLATFFIGIGMVRSRVFPRWFGWVAVILGMATVVAVGLPQALRGPSVTVTNVLFPILSGLSTVWMLVLGVWITRKAF